MNWFRLFAAFLLLFFSFTGILSNFLFFFFTYRKHQFRYAFYTFCRTKAVANILMALCFLFWATVCSFLGHTFLPLFWNIVIGQFSGIGVYMVGPQVTLFIAVNRVVASCFPMRFAKSHYGRQLTWGCILFAWIVAVAYFFMGLSDGCAYIYDVELLSWIVQDDPCAIYNIWFLLYSIVAVWSVSSVFNFCTFLKIMRATRRIRGTEKSTVIAKEKRNRILFIQNIILDSFILIDMILITFGATWSDSLWYQFFINSLIWILHINADGAVMLFCNVKFGKQSSPISTVSQQRITQLSAIPPRTKI